jgi:hypothetical protein
MRRFVGARHGRKFNGIMQWAHGGFIALSHLAG